MWKMNNFPKICALIHISILRTGILAVTPLSKVQLDIRSASRGYSASKVFILYRSANTLEPIYRNTWGKQMLFIAFNMCEVFITFFSGDISWIFFGYKMKEQWRLSLFYANVGNDPLTHGIKAIFIFIIQWPSNMGKINMIPAYSVELIHFLTV